MVDSIVHRNLVTANAIEDEKLLNYLKNWQYQPGNKAVSFPSLKTQLNELPGLFDDYKFSEWSQAHSCEYHTNVSH